MSGRFLLLVVAAVGWLIAGVFAYAFISLFGFFGVGFYGLLLLFICSQVGLESDGRTGRMGMPAEARQNAPRLEQASWVVQHSLNVRTFRYLGLALTVLGFGGFLYYQLE